MRADARVQVLGDPLDRAALAGGVAPLEEDRDRARRSTRTHSLSFTSSACSRSSSASYSLRGKLVARSCAIGSTFFRPFFPDPDEPATRSSIVETARLNTFLPAPYAKIELHLHLDCCASYGCIKALAPRRRSRSTGAS